MHKGLFHAVQAARALGLHVNITTNGTLVDKRWDALSQSGVDSLSFSIDGLERTHDRLRGKRAVGPRLGQPFNVWWPKGFMPACTWW